MRGQLGHLQPREAVFCYCVANVHQAAHQWAFGIDRSTLCFCGPQGSSSTLYHSRFDYRASSGSALRSLRREKYLVGRSLQHQHGDAVMVRILADDNDQRSQHVSLLLRTARMGPFRRFVVVGEVALRALWSGNRTRIYRLGREIFSRRAGLLAAFLLAINLFHIQYSQQARSYSLVVLLVVISFLSFLESVRQRPRLAWTICYVLCTTLALYAHFFAALAIVTQVICTLTLPDRRRIALPQLVRIGVVLVLGSPVLWFVLFRNRGQLNWIQPVHPRDLYHFLLYLTGSGVKFGIALIGFIVASKVSISRWRTRGWNLQTWLFFVVTGWFLLPICVTMLVSIWKPIYSPRFLIFCLPAALLLVGAGLAEITHSWITCVLIAMLTVGAVNPIRMYYADPGPEDWKSVVEFLSRNTTPGDIAYVPESYCALPLKYALTQASPKGFGLQITSTTPLAGETGHIWIIECSVAENLNPQPMFPSYNVKEARTFTAVQIFRLDKK